MFIFNVILIVLVVKFREPNHFVESLRSEAAVYVDINATTFTTITSWASTLAAILGGFVLMLAGDIARDESGVGLAHHSETVHLLHGVQVQKVEAGFSSSISVRNSAAGLLVAITDTWLHLSTEAVNLYRYSPSPGTNLSVNLHERCLINNNSYRAQSNWYFDREPGAPVEPACTLNPAAANTFLVVEDDTITGMSVLGNRSSTLTAKYHAEGGRVYFYLAPAPTEQNLMQDYSAETFAMSTTCIPKSVECGLEYEKFIGAATPFNCTKSGFSGDIQKIGGIRIQFYDDPEFTQTLSTTGVEGSTYSLLVAAFLEVVWPHPQDDPEVAHQVHGDLAMILGCTTTVYDVSYQYQNGSVVEWNARESNSSVTNALSSPITQARVGVTDAYQAFSYTGDTETAQRYADNWAAEYSRVAVSVSVTALRPVPAFSAQYRTPAIVSRIPIAPLAALLLSNFLYCLIGAILTIFAILAVREPETKEVVERTTVQSLVAAMFEPATATAPVKEVDNMFSELAEGKSQRVGIGRLPNGGYSYFLW
ncbi:hypothetical protein SAPIO_CDS2226 [Scedosporium apiospermum]|uniref:Uncharacterized protein n=1 Tax=Pseudallescheria apiosperma TaxID=563466 RepID=A0A084GDH9_PSEDA|nr:uncharacterized protein SAPIO_CDS2226 [Scedosporium apiospermum]KEZ45391.1 hypothetical protein SAPIO_CDS2226 [Scedosporium apiospermum]